MRFLEHMWHISGIRCPRVLFGRYERLSSIYILHHIVLVGIEISECVPAISSVGCILGSWPIRELVLAVSNRRLRMQPTFAQSFQTH